MQGSKIEAPPSSHGQECRDLRDNLSTTNIAPNKITFESGFARSNFESLVAHFLKDIPLDDTPGAET
jgi:hypothetical protein